MNKKQKYIEMIPVEIIGDSPTKYKKYIYIGIVVIFERV